MREALQEAGQTTSVRPELVEGRSCRWLRQAQPERRKGKRQQALPATGKPLPLPLPIGGNPAVSALYAKTGTAIAQLCA
jgi:hypothetical protein